MIIYRIGLCGCPIIGNYEKIVPTYDKLVFLLSIRNRIAILCISQTKKNNSLVILLYLLYLECNSEQTVLRL